MKRSKFTDEQILAIVKEGEAGRQRGGPVPHASASPSRPTTAGSRSMAGIELSEMQRLKQLEDENRRLKQIVAEQSLDIQALKAVVAKKW